MAGPQKAETLEKEDHGLITQASQDDTVSPLNQDVGFESTCLYFRV